ncbi:hypothetical protein GQ607_017882 [Colletotrichum asianum]|uniref:Uncharacterized protein n=1 Tax=Colletotrichum asianum TaxID=702518 RepID=A0A8H3VTY1_9PEZI|nr:hypothetical protein GQ607_017882 [Colletotrichum asianum]
MNLNILLTP